jgi:hypothetical protein
MPVMTLARSLRGPEGPSINQFAPGKEPSKGLAEHFVVSSPRSTAGLGTPVVPLFQGGRLPSGPSRNAGRSSSQPFVFAVKLSEVLEGRSRLIRRASWKSSRRTTGLGAEVPLTISPWASVGFASVLEIGLLRQPHSFISSLQQSSAFNPIFGRRGDLSSSITQ